MGFLQVDRSTRIRHQPFTVAAVGFAGLLVVILKGNEVRGLLLGIVKQALSL
ncbi:DUF4244 domain-containing protein [Cellulomonas sp. JH27-2]|uniref:DUF4244 domain-containing protein n=1 Tax=Cellulomonas sp. JH27-2 TaxID=2774139 RepID=UPI001CD8DCE7|nr:DUF4244 domain-containing protein [Cellulomonas sp. JH27-2]